MTVIENELQEQLKMALQTVRPATFYTVRDMRTGERRNHFLSMHGKVGEHSLITGATWHIGFISNHSQPWNFEIDIDPLHCGFSVGGWNPVSLPYWYIGITGQFASAGTGKFTEVASARQLGDELIRCLDLVSDAFEERSCRVTAS